MDKVLLFLMVNLPQLVILPFSNTTIAIGLSKLPIEWESLDGEPVTAVILFAVRDKDSNTLHLKLLQKVAMLLADEGFIDKLHKVSSKEELIELLK